MNKIRLIISVFLAVCLVIGWIAAFGENVGDLSNYNKAVTYAYEMIDKELYQKSVQAFETALSYKENEDLHMEMLKTYKLGIDDGVFSTAQYISACQTACEIYPDNASLWETIVEYYYTEKSYTKAYEWYNSSVKASAKSEKLAELCDLIMYAYTVKPTTYNSVIRTSNGYYTVKKADLWGVLNQSGEELDPCSYQYISPVSSQLDAMYKTSRGNRLYDASSIVQYRLTEDPAETLAFGCGFLPIKLSDDAWKFYDCENNCYVFDEYEAVSSFQNNYAFVYKDGVWSVINAAGEKYGNVSFLDVKLYDNGEYLYGDVFIAADSNGYHMFNESFEQMNSFSAVDMDNYFGSYIAYQSESGLWGYVDLKGNTVIEPQYIEAKSFSAGLAAIATEVYEEVVVEQDSKSETEDIPTQEETTESIPVEDTTAEVTVQEETVGETELESEQTTEEKMSEVETSEPTQESEAEAVVQAENDEVVTETVSTVKWGFINTSGKQVIESCWYYAGYFTSSGYALVADIMNSYYFIALRFV